MRTLLVVLIAGSIAMAQPPKTAAPMLPPPPALPTLPESPPPPAEFGVDVLPPVTLPPGTIVSPPGVRPPMPVAGPPIEVPPGPRVWLDFDYLMWRVKGGLAPALVAASPAGLPAPTVRSAYMVNDRRINGDVREGFRLGAGYWLDKPNGTGIEAQYTCFSHADDVATYTGNPSIFLSRPFWDAVQERQALLLLSTPNGVMQGQAQVLTSFDSQGAELNMWRRGPAMFSEEFHWIVGLRFWEMEEDLTVLAVSRTAAMQVNTFDTFATRNQFYGGQVGGRWFFGMNKFTFDFVVKLAAGAMLQQANIYGGTTVSLPNGTQANSPDGFLALSSNSGLHERAKFALIRDTSLTIGYQVTENVNLHVGGDFVYVGYVVRPGEQTDLGINPNLLPGGPGGGPARPGFRFNQEEFYMYGFHFGVTVQF